MRRTEQLWLRFRSAIQGPEMIVTSLPAVDSQTSPTFEKLVLALRPKLHGYSQRFFKNLSDREDRNRPIVTAEISV
jgi:hypothetical protein